MLCGLPRHYRRLWIGRAASVGGTQLIVLACLELGGLFIEEFFDVADSLIDLLIDVGQRFCQVVAVANKARLQLLLHVSLIPRGAGADH